MINLFRCCPNFPEGKDPRQHHKILHAHCLQCLHWVSEEQDEKDVDGFAKKIGKQDFDFDSSLPGRLPRGKKAKGAKFAKLHICTFAHMQICTDVP